MPAGTCTSADLAPGEELTKVRRQLDMLAAARLMSTLGGKDALRYRELVCREAELLRLVNSNGAA